MNAPKRPERMEDWPAAKEVAKAVSESLPEEVGWAYARVLFGADDLLRQYVEDLYRRSDPPPPVACCRGCSACCYLKVECHPIEIFGLAAYIRRSMRNMQVKELIARLRRNVAKTDGLDHTAYCKTATPCALLSRDGECTVYAARPLRCRGWTSYDRAGCERMLRDEHAPDVEACQWPIFAAELAMVGMNIVRPDDGVFDLQHGLLIALTEPDAFRRWYDGEDVLAPARDEHAAEVTAALGMMPVTGS